MEVSLRLDFFIHVGHFGMVTGYMYLREMSDMVLVEAYNVAYSIYSASTNMYKDLKQHF